MINPPHSGLVWVIGGAIAALSIGSLARWVSLRGADADVARSRLGSLKTWWALAILLALALLLGKWGVALLFTFASWLGLREYLRLVFGQEGDRLTKAVAYACVPINYLLIVLQWQTAFTVFVPLVAMLMLITAGVSKRSPGDYFRATAAVHWGLLLTVYGFSHAVLLFTLPVPESGGAASAGWFLFLVILTETDDIAQALVGRRIGKHKITPVISPNKTSEGFAGGLVTSILLALLLAPWLTPLADSVALERMQLPVPVPYFWAAVAGVLISLFGFLGDINMSAAKRAAGVKDGGTLLPGQGGMIDRIDSLTLAAPSFYYLVAWMSG